MGERALWPTVAVVGMVCAMLTTMVLAGIEPITLLAILGVLFTGIGSLIGVLLYGKIMKVEQNTNGNLGAQTDLVKQLIEQLRVSVPLDTVSMIKKEE